MTRRQGYWILGIVLLIFALIGIALWIDSIKRSTDRAFDLMESHPSPDGNRVLLIYRYDIGALGFSRTWWAVTPAAYTGLSLGRYDLPDGYIGVGWEPTGELLVRPWTPYYFKSTNRELTSGEVFHGVTVKLLPEEE